MKKLKAQKGSDLLKVTGVGLGPGFGPGFAHSARISHAAFSGGYVAPNF